MSAISTSYDNTVYSVDPSLNGSTSAASEGEGDFGAVLSSQLTAEDPSGTSAGATTTASADQLALTSYDPGQVTAYALSQSSEETATGETEASDDTAAAETAAASDAPETASSEETAEGEGSAETAAAGGAGWPGDGTYMAEWTPSGMQFFDELTGQWIDDSIPHRINESGDLEYCWEGNWYLDTATRHRMLVEGEYVEVEGQTTEGEASQSASAQTTLDESGPFEPEYYYNADLGQWKLFNFPTRENEDGTSEYYWQDQWWTDNWDHDYAASGTAAA